MVSDSVVISIEPPNLRTSPTSPIATQEPLPTVNAFEALEQCVDEEVPSPSSNKKRKNKSPGATSRQLTHSLVIGLGDHKAINVISRVSRLVGEAYTKVSGKKSARLVGLPPASSTTL